MDPSNAPPVETIDPPSTLSVMPYSLGLIVVHPVSPCSKPGFTAACVAVHAGPVTTVTVLAGRVSVSVLAGSVIVLAGRVSVSVLAGRVIVLAGRVSVSVLAGSVTVLAGRVSVSVLAGRVSVSVLAGSVSVVTTVIAGRVTVLAGMVTVLITVVAARVTVTVPQDGAEDVDKEDDDDDDGEEEEAELDKAVVVWVAKVVGTDEVEVATMVVDVPKKHSQAELNLGRYTEGALPQLVRYVGRLHGAL